MDWKPPCSSTVTRRGSTQLVVMLLLPKQELDLFATIKMTAILVTQESDLVLEDTMMTPTRVETRLNMEQIMATSTSRPWGTF